MATSLYKAQSVIQTCERHHPQELSYFCKSCKKFICTTCVKTDHTNHDWDLISAVAKQLRTVTPGKCRDIRGLSAAYKENLRDTKQRKYSNEEKKQAYLRKLEEARIAIIDTANNIVEKKRKKCNDLFEHERKSLEKKETEATEWLEYMKKMTSSLDTNIKAYSDYDVVEMEMKMMDMFQKLKTCDIDTESARISEIDIHALDKMIIGELNDTCVGIMATMAFEEKETAAICRIKKRPDFNGYGFNILNLPTSTKTGQYISQIKPGSPAETAGLTLWSRIVEINGVNVEDKSHDDVIKRVVASGKEIKLLIQ